MKNTEPADLLNPAKQWYIPGILHEHLGALRLSDSMRNLKQQSNKNSLAHKYFQQIDLVDIGLLYHSSRSLVSRCLDNRGVVRLKLLKLSICFDLPITTTTTRMYKAKISNLLAAIN
jgi:hypothetical protein